MSERITVDVDTSEGMKKLQELETARQNTVRGVNMALDMARAAYLGMVSIVRIGGGTVEYLFRTVISAGLSMISILTPILTAEEVTPGMQVQATLGFINLGIAIGAITAAQYEQQKLANQLHSANALMHSVQMFISNIPSLW